MELLLQAWNLLQVPLGIGIVIFVHEAGHFIAARACGVRVDVFSLGFGPRLVGWQRGPTLYQIALVPIGGYVKMSGEDPYGEGAPPAPDDLRSKSVGQRFLIFSGGVIMNVVFALVIFPIIFSVGVPFEEPRISDVAPGGPAWQKEIQPGSRVLSVNGEEPISYMHVLTDVALSPDGVDLVLEEPGGESGTRSVHLNPEYDEAAGRYTIGVSPMAAVSADHVLHVEPDSPAHAAGLRSGDHLVDVAYGLPEQRLITRFYRACNSGDPVAVTVARGKQEYDYRIDPEMRSVDAPPMLGVSPIQNKVTALRANEALFALGLQRGDVLLTVQGERISSSADLAQAVVPSREPLRFEVERAGTRRTLTGPALERETAWHLASDIALEPDLESSAIAILAGSPADRAGLRDGDTVLEIDGARVRGWRQIQERTKVAARAEREMELVVRRDGPDGPELLTLHATPAPREAPYLGAAFEVARYDYRSPSLVAAIRDGTRCSWKFLSDAWLTLKRLLRGQVSMDNVGGIITIGFVSHKSAEIGFTYLLFFLCMLSVNLAFLNVLPIPILDGGHLFFLLIEKIKGSPVSERVFGYSQMVGLVMILSLMIYVTFNDVVRWFFPS